MDTVSALLRARFGGAPDPVAVRTDPLSSGTPVVVKAARTVAERAALAREVEVSLRLSHPAFRRVRATWEDEGARLAALEHVDGEALDAHLARVPGDARRVALALLGALRVLHAAGLAHGDLKPEHVLVEASGAVRLIDLGLVTPLGETVRGGTHGFLAPELLEGSPVSVASDLYALGATLAQALGDGDPLAPLTRACLRADPGGRPSSAGAAMAMLGGAGSVATASRADTAALRACLRATGGAVLVVDAPAGGGRSAIVRAFVQERLARDLASLDLVAEPAFDPFHVLAELLDPELEPVEPDGVASPRSAVDSPSAERPDDDRAADGTSSVNPPSAARSSETARQLGSRKDAPARAHLGVHSPRSAPLDPEHASRVARAAAWVAARDVPIVIDDADRLDADARGSLLMAAEAIAAGRRGALLVVGPKEPLVSALVERGGAPSPSRRSTKKASPPCSKGGALAPIRRPCASSIEPPKGGPARWRGWRPPWPSVPS